MIIECPKCQTRFKLDDSRISASRVTLRCSRCQHTFPFSLPTAPEPIVLRPMEEAEAEGLETDSVPHDPAIDAPSDIPSLPRPTPAPRPRSSKRAANPDFSFDEVESWDPPRLEEEQPEKQFSLGIDSPTDRAAEKQKPRKSRVRPPAPPVDADDEDDDEEIEDQEQSAFDDEDERRGISLTPLFVFIFLFVVPAYVVLAITLNNSPEWAEEVARKLPFIGSINRDRLLNRKVVINEVQSSYERIKEGREVFIVSGEAVNYAPISLTNIQILIRLMTPDGKLIDERTVFCGSSIPKKLVRDLSMVEASIIGQLKPPKTFMVQPGERSPFVVVFPDLPAHVGEVSVQVFAAQGQA